MVTAALLPPDIGEVLPTVGDSDSSAHLMSLPLRDAREVFERQYLMAQIERFGGNISKTAEFVGMERSALHRKIKSLGLVAGLVRPGRQRDIFYAIVAPRWENEGGSGRAVGGTCANMGRGVMPPSVTR